MNRRTTTFLLFLLGLVALYHLLSRVHTEERARVAWPRAAAPAELEAFSLVYFATDDATRTGIRATDAGGITIVTTQADLQQALAQQPEGAAILLDRASVAQVDRVWLRAQYRAGVAVVGVGVPLGQLGAAVDIRPDIADLRLEYARGRVTVALLHAVCNGQRGQCTCKHQYTDFHNDYRIALTAITVSLASGRRNLEQLRR